MQLPHAIDGPRRTARLALTAGSACVAIFASGNVVLPAQAAPAPRAVSTSNRGALHTGRYGLTPTTAAPQYQHLAATPQLQPSTGRVQPSRAAASRATGSPAPSHVVGAPPADAPTVVQGFSGNRQGDALSAYGGDQGVQPPDPDIAAGPSAVIEVTNSRMIIFNRDGSQLASADINQFVNVNAGAGYTVTDPRVVYDAQSGRFFFNVLEFQQGGCGSDVVLLTSPANGDLTGSWTGIRLPDVAGGTTGDQPVLGFSNNLVAVSWNYFTCSGSTIGNFAGSELNMVQKSDLLANRITSHEVDYYTGGPFSADPVKSIGSIGLQYVVYNRSPYGLGFAVAFAFTGTPEQQNMPANPHGFQFPITATAPPPATGANQAGTSATVQTDDDRFLGAVWSGGAIWTAGNTACTPSGDSASRSCLDYVHMAANTAGTVTSGGQLPFVGVNGADLYYPAVSLDSSNDMITVFHESSPSLPISIMTAGINTAAGGTSLTNFATLRTSSTYYAPGGPPPARWGDYLGAAQDPNHPTDVWVVGQDVEGDGPPCGSINTCWDTYIGRYTFHAPIINSLTPAAGPITGGQTVTVNGSDFLPGSTATLDGAPVTMVNQTPDSFQFTTPSHAAGLVYLQVTSTLGSSPLTSTAGYIFTPLGNYTQVPPFRIYDSRNGSCVNCAGAGPVTGGVPRTVTIAGASLPGPDQVVPTNASAVVLNVTVANVTAGSFLTVYPNGTGRPNASNLNFVAHQTIANLVTVTLGQNSPGDTNREVNVFNRLGNADVIIDVAGYFTPTPSVANAGLFHAIPPLRICDSRGVSGSVSNNVCNHGSGSSQPLGARQATKVNVTGPLPGGSFDPNLNVPADGTARAVALNLTAVSGTGGTYLSLYPPDSSGSCALAGNPTFSNVNVNAGAVQPNRVMVPLGPDTNGGPTTDICVFNFNGSINFIADLNGWYGSGSESPLGTQYQAIGPSRICDSRALTGTECSGQSLSTGTVNTVQVAGVGGVPAAGTPVAIIANVTGVSAAGSTYLTVYPADVARPNTSDLNITRGVTIPNLVVVRLSVGGPAGAIDIFNHQAAINYIVDVGGWFQ